MQKIISSSSGQMHRFFPPLLFILIENGFLLSISWDAIYLNFCRNTTQMALGLTEWRSESDTIFFNHFQHTMYNSFALLCVNEKSVVFCGFLVTFVCPIQCIRTHRHSYIDRNNKIYILCFSSITTSSSRFQSWYFVFRFCFLLFVLSFSLNQLDFLTRFHLCYIL